MHPRNPYRHPPDFHDLAELLPDLKPYLLTSPSGKCLIDFKDPNAQRVLTQALLKRDFNLTLSLPEHRLCPPVPNRLNYVLWIQDILFPFHEMPPDKEIKGIDIGTGASAIYPLLACSQPNTRKWTFIGTEVDPLSASFASRNVEANNLQSRISIWPIHSGSHTSSEGRVRPNYILAPLIEDSESSCDFTMCNPPFYCSRSEIENSAEAKEMPPSAICTGAETEMITPGGETAFVLQMLRESAREDVRERCRWFTSMLGKLGSVGEIVRELRSLKVDNYALTQFIQGTTRRWAVAWSFGEERLPDMITRPSSASLSSYLPAPTTLRQTVVPYGMSSSSSEGVPPTFHKHFKSNLWKVLASIEGAVFQSRQGSPDCPTDDELWKIDVVANENTWSRAARRKRKRSSDHAKPPSQRRITFGEVVTMPPRDQADNAPDPPLQRPKLQCQIRMLPTASGYVPHAKGDPRPGSLTLEAQWIRGKDRSLFEGFWSHVCRKAMENIESGTS